MLTAQLNAALVTPEAAASTHSAGEPSSSRATCGRHHSIKAVPSMKNEAVAHNGCSPASCRRRSGHHDTPHTPALNTRASKGRVDKWAWRAGTGADGGEANIS